MRCLNDLDREDAAWDFDRGLPDCAREALALFDALQPVIPIALKLGFGRAPGADADEDASWAASLALARRNVLARQAGGIGDGLAADNLRLLDRIETLIGVWPDDDWADVVRCRVEGLVDASQRGAQRATSFARAVIKPRSRTVSRSPGCCATRPITGCVQRFQRSLTLSAAC